MSGIPEERPVVKLPSGAMEPPQVAVGGIPAPSTPRPAKAKRGEDDPATPSTCCTECSPQRELHVCRFCLESEEILFEEHAGTPAGDCVDLFVTPCPCRGSTKYVHLDCLVQCFVAQGSWHNFCCPTCKQQYEGRSLRRLAEVSLEKMLEAHGSQAPQVAHSLVYLAQAHVQLGDILEGKECLETGLVILEAHFGQGHIATAATLAELATAYGKLGNIQTQKDLLERSLELKEQHFGSGHINTAVTLNNLATAHSELGNVQQEKDLLQRSLTIKEKHYGKGHVQTTAALVNFARFHSELGDVAKGLELLEWSLEIEERHFGEGHVETAITLNNLALACGESGNLKRMQELLVKCLAIKEHHFGASHQELCLTLSNLGMACSALGEIAAAKHNCERSLRVCADQNPSRRVGVVLLRAASVHAALGEEFQASQLAGRAVAVLQESLGAAASRRVLDLEAARMSRIWTAMGHAAVPQCLKAMLDELGTSDSSGEEMLVEASPSSSNSISEGSSQDMHHDMYQQDSDENMEDVLALNEAAL